MQFGKLRMFFYFNGIIALSLLLYFSPWLFSRVAVANVVTPYEVTTLQLQYEANGKLYTNGHMRNDIPFQDKTVRIRYLIFHPSSSRVDSFMGMWAEPLAWWSVLLLASAMLLLTHNTVFSKGTVFHIHKRFPWISMDEFYPYYGYWQSPGKKDETNDIMREAVEISLLKERLRLKRNS
ncbi:MAG TPA: hypothetical protein VJ499_03240 [Flavisolibacter sp.]|nr:hypothetical protein [Flavisolibacter sp.]